MSKVIIEYDLNNDEDEVDFKRAINCDNVYSALYDIYDKLRNQEKYGSDHFTLKSFSEILNENDVNINDVF